MRHHRRTQGRSALFVAVAFVGAVASAPALADGFPDEGPAKPQPREIRPQARLGDHRSPAHLRSQASLRVLPNEGSARATGVQVWQVVDGEAEFISPPMPPRSVGYMPPPVEVASIARGTPPNVIGGMAYPNETPRPEVVPGRDYFDGPSLDERVAATIPSNAEDVIPVDPDRFDLTPVALHLENATIDEIITSLVPRQYRISFDVPAELRHKTYKVAIQTTLKSALLDLGQVLGVNIRPYHKLQLVLVTDAREGS